MRQKEMSEWIALHCTLSKRKRRDHEENKEKKMRRNENSPAEHKKTKGGAVKNIKKKQ
jgi:hypothetical protein